MLCAVGEKSRKITFVERKDDRLYLKSEAGIHRLELKDARTVRITYTQQDCFSDKKKPGIVCRNVSSDWSYEQSETELVYSTDCIRIQINLETADFCYYDKNGNRLFREYGKELEEFKTYRITEDELRIEKVTTADGVKDVVREAAKIQDGTSFHTRFYMEWDKEEALYGLGQHEDGIGSLRGQTVYVHQANRKIAIPLLVSTKGYGMLIDTYSPMIFSDTVYGSYICTEADSEIDYYFMYGGNMDSVINEYRMLTGKASMLPRWAFGYWQSQERYETQQEILETAREYRERGIGLDCIVLDWCSWEGNQWGQKSFDTQRFPNPKEMTDKLHENHVHFMLSIWPNMDESTDNYKEFKKNNLLLPGCNVYNPYEEQGRKLYWEQIKEGLFCHGVDAWWCDNSEPLTPEWNHICRVEASVQYAEYCKTAAIHLPVEETNAYALYHARAIYEGQRAESEKRVLNLTRSAYTGQQRYGTVMWSGDIDASWDTLRKQITAGLQFCASGLPYWTADIGAFFVKRGNLWYWKGNYNQTTEDMGYRELFVRWYQWAAFLPIFRGHGTDCRRELWHIANSEVLFYDALLAINKLRYELIPYIYSYAGLSWLENGSMMRLLAFAYPKDRKVWNITDQYMFGNELMVCPVTKPMYYDCESKKLDNVEKVRMVYLPEGNGWYDFWTSAYYKGGQWVRAETPIHRIPVFVKEGSIIPKVQSACSVEEQEKAMHITVYGGANAEFVLYEDDGDGHSYEDGCYSITGYVWSEEQRRLYIKKKNEQLNNEKLYRIEKVILVQKNDLIQEVKDYEETSI